MEIKPANELKATKEKMEALEHCKKYLMMDIEEANKAGRTKTCFSPTGTRINGIYIDCTEELKLIFKEAGYGFSPTGYIGNVLQTTTDITW